MQAVDKANFSAILTVNVTNSSATMSQISQIVPVEHNQYSIGMNFFSLRIETSLDVFAKQRRSLPSVELNSQIGLILLVNGVSWYSYKQTPE